MPFFGSTRHPAPEPEPVPEPEPRRGLFHRNREPEYAAPVHHEPVHEKKHGLFGRRTSSPSPPPAGRHSMSSNSSGHSHHGGSMSRTGTLQKGGRHGGMMSRLRGDNDVDPSIAEARERVLGAEAAEIEADRALDAARMRVREAREHMKIIEEEAREDARRAKIKQAQAADLTKRGKGLGRKFYPSN